MAFIYDLSDTWNNAGISFNGIKLNATDTASAAGSKLLDLQISGVSKFTVGKTGTLTATGLIESTVGGFKFPDGTTQTTRATVNSVSGTGSVSGLTLTGTVTNSGSLTLGGTLALTSANVTTGLGYTPYNSTNPAGYLSIVSLTSNVTGTLPIANGGTGATSAATALTSLGAYPATNPSSYITTAGARSAISVSGSLAYNSTTGVISFTDAVTSVAGKTGAVTLTNADVGLGNVENKSSTTIRSEITSGNVTTALGYTPANKAGDTFTGTITLPSTTSIGTVSATEIGYLDGVTSAIQAQIDAKADLSSPEVTAQALHRSPNAITAMTIYDTSKDSDGGAWTERCQHTSWYNEPIMGKWLGPQPSELFARYAGATFGSELVVNGDFTTTTGWTANLTSTVSSNGQTATYSSNNASYPQLISTGFTTVVGRSYVVKLRARKVSGNTITAVAAAGGFGGAQVGSVTIEATNDMVEYSFVFLATATTMYAGLFGGQNPSTSVVEIDYISCREVTAITTASGDYYQSTADGKFYRLWKNLLSRSEEFDNAVWTKTTQGIGAAPVVTANGAVAPNGTTTAESVFFNSVGTGGADRSVLVQNVAVTANTQFACSIWLRSATPCIIALNANTTNTGSGNVSGDLLANVTSTWQRFQTSVAYSGTVGGTFQFYIRNQGINQLTSTVEIYGAQLEVGSVVTTYEPKAADGTITQTFRGNKRDFPRLAAIVVEALSVTIYDLTETGRPMWMAFGAVQSSINLPWVGGGSTFSGAASLNGNVCVTSLLNNGIAQINFAADSGYVRNQYSAGPYLGNIAQRHSALGYVFSDPASARIASSVVNAIAMTVLPDAPLDPATGLRVPTIAVATGGGVSVIKHNGTVVNSAAGNTFLSVTVSQYGVTAHRLSSVLYYTFTNPTLLSASFAMSIAQSASAPDFQQANSTSNYRTLASSGKIEFVTTPTQGRAGFNRLKASSSDWVRGISASVMYTHNTGWMTGDIRRAYLSDTVVENVGPSNELITNGTFDTDLTGWTVDSPATASVIGGVVRIVPNGDGYGRIKQSFPTIVGRVYRVTGNCVSKVGGQFRANVSDSGTNWQTNRRDVAYFNTASAVINSTFVASATTTWLYLSRDSVTNVGDYMEYDNISVTEVVADRSYKAQAANINGTVTKSQLATGTSLVAYSGFSAANYLQEPYSTDLDLGTGEWSASAWVNAPTFLRKNLLLRTEAFENAYWTQARVTITQQSSVLSPVGSTTTRLFVPTAAAGDHGVYPPAAFLGGAKVLSIYAKQGSGSYKLALHPSANSTRAVFNLITGQVDVNDSGQTASIFDVGDGWYRCSVTVSSLADVVKIYVADGSNAVNYVADGSSGIYLWSSQLELGTTATSYQPVTDGTEYVYSVFERAHSSGSSIKLRVNSLGRFIAEAFDGATTRSVTTSASYNTGQWLKAEANYTTDGSLAIMVNGREAAVTRGNPLLSLNSRYNLSNYSEAINNLNKANMTITDGALASPVDGSMSLSNVVPTGAAIKYLASGITLASGLWTGKPFAMRFIAKANGYSKIMVGDGHGNSFPATVFTFDLVAGTTNHANATMVDLGSGFWECRILIPSSTSTYNLISPSICPYPNGASLAYGGATFTADGSGAYIGQLQIENWPTWRAYQKTTTVAETNVAPLTIGNSFAADAPFAGSIALLKIGATVPTPEQSAFMYEQEKQLFRSGAQSVMPDSGAIIDMSYDDATDRWVSVSATNESYWTGLVRNTVTPVPAGSYTKIAATSGIELAARSTVNAGVDVTIPAYVMREELLKRSETAAKLNAQLANFDYVGGFTASTTVTSTAITSVAGITYPTAYIGARVTGTGIPANTTIVAVSGTTIYLSAAATVTATGVAISFQDFILPVGLEAKEVSLAGVAQREGSTAQFTRLFDGFKETIRFGTAPSNTALIQIQAARAAS